MPADKRCMGETGSSRPDLRRHPRQPFEADVRIFWQDGRGVTNHASGRCVNVSEAGMAIEVTEPLPLRTYVHFEIARPRFGGTASVRYCQRRGLKSLVGLEFSGSLRWTAQVATPAGAVEE